MFTGLVEETGRVVALKKAKTVQLTLAAKLILSEIRIGDSVAVNGVCLTVTAIKNSNLTFDIMPQTFAQTGLANLRKGSVVNLERALLATARLGGHFVSGHVDCVGKITKIVAEKDLYRIALEYPPQYAAYVVTKGSIALEGISLTVQAVSAQGCEVGIIPHTLKSTNLFDKKAGALVNIEFDMLAKYVENILTKRQPQTVSRLKKYIQG